ncbi:MAG: WhiB family transcriptional regulator [Sciscionella sp.]
MLTATVPCWGGATGETALVDDGGVVDLLDDATSAGAELPCRVEPDLWFAEAPGELERAKTLCASCPVRRDCLAGALSRQEPWGVWGGEIFERGTVIARKRPRGRPRKGNTTRATAA